MKLSPHLTYEQNLVLQEFKKKYPKKAKLYNIVATAIAIIFSIGIVYLMGKAKGVF